MKRWCLRHFAVSLRCLLSGVAFSLGLGAFNISAHDSGIGFDATNGSWCQSHAIGPGCGTDKSKWHEDGQSACEANAALVAGDFECVSWHFQHIGNIVDNLGNKTGEFTQYKIADRHGLTNRVFRHVRCDPGFHLHYVHLDRDLCQKDPVNGPKEGGKPDDPSQSCDGDPCNAITGNLFEVETDYVSAGPFPLRFERVYNSQREGAEFDGADWRHWYQRSIFADPTETDARAEVFRADGQVLTFRFGGSGWISDPDVVVRLTEKTDSGQRTGWRLIDADDTVETYDAQGRLETITNRDGFTQELFYDAGGRLVSVTGPFGRTLSFTHNSAGRIESMTDPAGNVYRYAYDELENLVSVTYPDATPDEPDDNPVLRYHYENSALPYHLTGITDENGHRFATFEYDGQGRATMTQQASGANRIDITYNPDGTSTVTDALGNVTVREAEVIHGVRKMTGVNAPCSLCNQRFAAMSYDKNGFFASQTDFNGNVTLFEHNNRGLEVSRTEAAGTGDERTILTEWHPQFRRPVRIIEPGRETTFTYDTVGRLLTRTVTDAATGQSRTTTRTYTLEGLLLSLDGPRTDVADVTTFEYDVSGNLVRTSNALGHVTEVIAHDAHGRPLTIVDPNGVMTELRYNARGQLTSREVAGSLTTFDYDPAVSLVRTTLPDGSFIENTYDAAQRLVAIEDNLGNRIEYTLDALGNRIEERILDPEGTLRRSRSRVFDLLNRVEQQIGGVEQTTVFGYDDEGNIVSVTDPNNHATLSAYDALNRLVETTAPDGGVAKFRYDRRDNLISVTDPRGLETLYDHNAFDEVVITTSPDTGVTTQAYDAAGNRITRTDSRGVKATFEYDALNRLTAIRYPNPAENVTFVYDEGENGIGRLTSISDEPGSLHMRYDARGNVIKEVRVIGNVTLTTAYEYDSVDRLTGIDYPGGVKVRYERDALGRIVSATASMRDEHWDRDEPWTVVEDISYAPFGPAVGWTFGNGISLSRTLDEDYRLTGQQAPPVQNLGFDYDAAGNILAIIDGNDDARTQYFDYDPADRLTYAKGPYGIRHYTYDRVGNRRTRIADGDLDNYTYAPLANQLLEVTGTNPQSFAYDPAGNTISKPPFGFEYNDTNRLAEIIKDDQNLASYRYNALGQRVKKTVEGETTLFQYDLQGDLLGEYDAKGNLLRTYIYVDGERVALMMPKPPGSVFDRKNHPRGRVHKRELNRNIQTLQSSDSTVSSDHLALAAKQWKVFDGTFPKVGRDLAEKRLRDIRHLDRLRHHFSVNTLQSPRLHLQLGRTKDLKGFQIFFYHNDHLGTPKDLTDEDQIITWKGAHTPFGTAAVSINTIENNLRFPGQYFDAETAQNYNYFRNYDTSIGRYMESDPLGLSSGLNTYVYALSNTIRYIDLDGLEVRFICRPLKGLAAKTGKQHCFVFVSCPQEGWQHSLSLFASGTNIFGWPNRGRKAIDDPTDHPWSTDNAFDGLVEPNKCLSGRCEFEKAVLERWRSFPKGDVPYSPLGPNSNSFASDLATGTQFGGKLPRGAPRNDVAPGINMRHPNFP